MVREGRVECYPTQRLRKKNLFDILKLSSLLAASFVLMACSPQEKGVSGVDNPTPIRYVICGAGQSACFVAVQAAKRRIDQGNL